MRFLTGPEKRKTLSEATLTAIRNMILKGDVRPGAHINIDEMSRLLNCSKTPVREALKVLISEELVHYAPNIGYSVKEVDLREYMQTYELQELLETHILRRIAEMKYLVDFELLESLNEELARMIENGEWGSLGEQNDRFHLAFYCNYPNPMLVEMVQDIWNKVRIQRNLIFQSRVFISTAIADHREMMEAVRNGDPDAAERVSRKHFSRGIESLLNFFPSIGR